MGNFSEFIKDIIAALEQKEESTFLEQALVPARCASKVVSVETHKAIVRKHYEAEVAQMPKPTGAPSDALIENPADAQLSIQARYQKAIEELDKRKFSHNVLWWIDSTSK